MEINFQENKFSKKKIFPGKFLFLGEIGLHILAASCICYHKMKTEVLPLHKGMASKGYGGHMNCCWILLLLFCCGRGGCSGAVPCTSGCSCRCGRREPGNVCAGREQESGCGCQEARPEPRHEEKHFMEKRDDCDVASTIPQTWQEYARRDAEDCHD